MSPFLTFRCADATVTNVHEHRCKLKRKRDLSNMVQGPIFLSLTALSGDKVSESSRGHTGVT